MRTIRRGSDRGHFDHGWLDTFHTFSFGDFHDPQRMGFRSLRVINEDRVAPGTGFGMHGHRDMEIITCILAGQLEHKDSLGTGSVIGPNDLQRMTAGSGIRHSEFNPSGENPVHLLQIWILPEARGLTPEYEERVFPADGRQGRWQIVASPDGQDGSLRIHQDVRLFRTALAPHGALDYQFAPGRYGWLQVASGQVRCGDETLEAGDAMQLEGETSLQLSATAAADLLLFDLS